MSVSTRQREYEWRAHTTTDAVAKEDGAMQDYAGTSRGPAGTNRAAGGDDFDDDERQYEGDGIVGDDEI